MKKPAIAFGRLAALILVTLFSVAVMFATAVKSTPNGGSESAGESATKIAAAAPVVVSVLRTEPIEILDIYSGMIQPFERYSVAFEIPGRIIELGQTSSGVDLDEGDAVHDGQVLAVMDQRILKARVQETQAILEQAQQELQRAKQLRNRRSQVITETEFQRRVTELAIAEAQFATAEKNLEDATLISPCDGRISKRMVNEGESITMHQPVFEIVEVDRLLLVVGVPESRVRELENRRKQINQRASDGATVDEPFRAYVQLMGTSRFGVPWPVLEAEVFRIGETADDKTGLFEVEILLDNQDRSLKPGQVAVAKIVIDYMQGYRIPIESVLFRGDIPYVYAVQESSSDLNFMFWNLGPAADFKALRVPLARYIEQEGTLIVPNMPEQATRIVVRGQHRLVNDRRVRIVTENSDSESQPSSTNNSSTADGQARPPSRLSAETTDQRG